MEYEVIFGYKGMIQGEGVCERKLHDRSGRKTTWS